MLNCLFTELGLSDLKTPEEQPIPELEVLSIFYENICNTLPVDELLPMFVSKRVIEVKDKTKISAYGKTEFERSQYLLDYYIARPLSTEDNSAFNKFLNVVSTSSKCGFLITEMKHQLFTTMKHHKFSDELM